MSEELNIIVEPSVEDIKQEQVISIPGTPVRLTSCECPQRTTETNHDAATECRVITVPVKIKHLCPGKEYIIFVTVYDFAYCSYRKIGQKCSIVLKPRGDCNVDYTQYVTLVIKKPVCSSDCIWVKVEGNYTGIC